MAGEILKVRLIEKCDCLIEQVQIMKDFIRTAHYTKKTRVYYETFSLATLFRIFVYQQSLERSLLKNIQQRIDSREKQRHGRYVRDQQRTEHRIEKYLRKVQKRLEILQGRRRYLTLKDTKEIRAIVAHKRLGALGKYTYSKSQLPCECGCGELAKPGKRYLQNHVLEKMNTIRTKIWADNKSETLYEYVKNEATNTND